MAIRNFYLKSKVDGRRTTTSCGPGAKGGGMTTTIFQRDRGGSLPILEVLQRTSKEDSILITEVVDLNRKKVVFKLVTFRD